MKKTYDIFLDCLYSYKRDKVIKILHRGINKEFAFKTLNLDLNHNSIEQFAERLFFYGEKSKYFWNEKISSKRERLEFDINDISDDFFRYIFSELNQLISNHTKPATSRFFKRNLNTVSFFSNSDNINSFFLHLHKLSSSEKTQIRNHYLRILHQLGETDYYATSQFLSSTTSENVAKKFAKNEIVINFWELNIKKDFYTFDIPYFIGKPYKNQKEISVFTVILPQYIYSFTYKGKTYLNPAIEKIVNPEIAIFSGLDIEQSNFPEKLKANTNYIRGVITDGEKYDEII